MWRFVFFVLGVPMMIMSFFEAVDVLPYVQNLDLYVNGNQIVLTEEEQANLQQKVEELFDGSHTMPAFGVTFPKMHEEAMKDGIFISLKFGQVLEVNELPFDELVFQIRPDFHGFNLERGLKGVFEGRCIYIDLLEKDMSELYDAITSLTGVQNVLGENVQTPEIEKEELPEIETSQEIDVKEKTQEEIEQNVEGN